MYCVEHKLDFHIDVKRKSCQHPNCNKRPTFGLPGHPLSHCTEHKQINQIRKSKSKCKENNCVNKATFGLSFPIYCEEHKKSNHKDLVNRICNSCNLPNILNEKLLCEYCDPNTIKTVRLKKQNKVKDCLDNNELKYISTDKIIDNGKCGKERPDFLFDFGSFMLIVEVDENQHKERNCECEIIRMVNIYNSLGIKTLFIRFNPDKYKVKYPYNYIKGKMRREFLVKQILYWKENYENIKEGCSVTYMFFDEDDSKNWKESILLN